MSFAEEPPDPPPHIFWAGRRTEMLAMPGVHAHSQVELNLILCGEATYVFGGRDVTVHADDFMLFWGVVPHQTVRVAEGTRFVCLYLPIEMFLAMPLSAALRECVLAGGMVAALEPLEAGWPQRLHDELLSGDARLAELDRLEIELRLRRLDLTGWTDLAEMGTGDAGRRGGRHAKVCAMAQFLTLNATGPVTAAAVGSVAGLHPNYAMTLFKGALGMTPGEYLTRYRLYLAQSMLLAGGRDVASIAFDAGFGSVSRFHDAFRRRFGISPHRFRRSAARATDRRGKRVGEA
jgi:AraC-like DNA-binding protein